MIFKDYKLYFTLKSYKRLFCTRVSAGAKEVGPNKMKHTVQGTNTVCQFNVNKTPGYNKGYNNVPFPIYGSPTTVDN